MSKSLKFILWIILSVLVSIYLFLLLGKDVEPKVFIAPGKMTQGHYQIEQSCTTCHTDGYKGHEVIEKACMDCHSKELKKFRDKHPFSKFRDPRNADRLENIDALKCITCHSEHNFEETHKIGVTQPSDYCFKCHKDIAKDRPSHKGMKFNTCSTTGCHNYHDNQALYEDFLLKHRDENATFETARVKKMTLQSYLEDLKKEPLTLKDADGLSEDKKVFKEWAHSSHAQSGVNCSSCHTTEENPEFNPNPTPEYCVSCHKKEVKGFLDSKHGMRIKAGLSPMTPAQARLPMHAKAGHKELTCTSCHSDHSFSTKDAQVDACMQCHNDQHTNNYKNSKHFTLYTQAKKGMIKESEAVSCATCHMPKKKRAGKRYTEHNQNLNLRPQEKMARSVCMDCHGLSFTLDSLADKALIRKNFSGKPSMHIRSIDLAVERDNQPRKGGK